MLISIIIPVFNRAQTIERCLKSVMENFPKKKEYELIIIDDGSQDSSLNIAKEILKRTGINFRYFINEKNLGTNISRNKGYENAKGNWCIFLDSDDEICISQNKIKYLFDKFDNVELISFRCKNSCGNLIGIKYTKQYIFFDENYYLNNFYKLPEVLDCVNKRIISEEKIFCEQFRLGCEFVSWSYLISKYKKKLLINQFGRIYNDDSINQISNIPKNKRKVDFYNAYKLFFQRYSKKIELKVKFHIFVRLVYYSIFNFFLNK